MIVQINGVAHMFKWQHEIRQTEKKKFSSTVPKQNGATTCFCYKLTGPGKDDRELVHQATVHCNHKDLYTKEEGRKRSLTAVLDFDRSIEVKLDSQGEPVIKEQYYEGDNRKLEMTHVTIFEMEIKDNGYFDKASRTAVWSEYELSKLPTEKDRLIQFESELNKLLGRFPDLGIDLTKDITHE